MKPEYEWKPMREADKEYNRAIQHYKKDPLLSEAAVLPCGQIVGSIWNTSRGWYVQQLWEGKWKTADLSCIKGPFTTDQDAKVSFAGDWACRLEPAAR